MKKAYSFTELLIVISLIAIMAVTAIPSFSNYGKKAELDNKAEEIKYLIERAYANAVSPAIGLNGVIVELAAGTNSEIRSKKGVFSDECKININDDNCAFSSVDSDVDIIEIQRNDSLRNLTIANATIYEKNDKITKSPMGLIFISPADQDSVYVCVPDPNNNKIPDYNNSLGLYCNTRKDQVVIKLGSEVGARDIVINRNPFSVSVIKVANP